MLFNTVEFAVFFALVFPLYWLLRTPGRQNVLLLLASYVFYSAWDWRFSFLLAGSTCIDFWCGRKLEGEQDPQRRRHWLTLSLLANLGTLGFFKYFNFFAESLVEAFGALGWSVSQTTLDVVLPVGISFYTFQTLSYTIDVYRRRVDVEHDFVRFAVYVAYFPQLVAGPIERAQRLLPQLAARRRVDTRHLLEGSYLVVRGLFKKCVVADNLAPNVDAYFSASSLGASEVWLASVAFAFQIYGDFSGYTDIARGVSRMLGIELVENFASPYMAQNPQDFWHRWHVSLSSWLRDYLYVPLGGNRHGSLMLYRNLLLTMVLGGLWHGAAWTFVVWGAYQGGLLAIHRLVRGRRPEVALPERWTPAAVLHHVLGGMLYFQLTCVGWLIFRAESIGQLGSMLAALAGPWQWGPEMAQPLLRLVHFSWFVMADQVACYFGRARGEHTWPLLRICLAVYMFVHLLTEGAFDRGQQFIYFQF